MVRVGVSYDKENDRLFFTKIDRRSVRLDDFFTKKLYGNRFEDLLEKRASVAETFAIINFPKIKKFENFVQWGKVRAEERKQLIEILKKLYKMTRMG